MKTSNPFRLAASSARQEIERFRELIDANILDEQMLHTVIEAADLRSIPAEFILRHELQIPRQRLLEALACHYGCGWAIYDERIPVPPDLLEGLDAEVLCASRWFPVMRCGDCVVIAANDPQDPLVLSQVRRMVPAQRYEFRVALVEDIESFIQDFVNGPPRHLIGNERTGLAFWRNIMSRWRTRMACYRTDFAITRTHFGSLRWGLGMITTGRTLLEIRANDMLLKASLWTLIGLGIAFLLIGIASYFRIKKSLLSPPAPQTLIEVSAITMHFLENYQFGEKEKTSLAKGRQTMLARLTDMLPNACVFIENSPDNKIRSFLAHERTALAAQRTVLACYRTIYARARTGLSFIRTGVSFASIGVGLIGYFGVSWMSVLDGFTILAGAFMIVDGLIWYWPVRKEQREAPSLVQTC